MNSAVRDPMSKHWCFTLNNYTEVEHAALLSTPHDYVVIGKEVGDNGTPHLQGYIIFVNRKRLAGCKKISPRAHWEIKSKNSTCKEASEYCKKDAQFVEDGSLPLEPHQAGGQATKEKWAEALASAKVNMLDDIAPKMLIQNYQTFKRIAQDYQQVPPELPGVCGEWYYGEPRTGKSRAARDLYPGFYDKPCNKWWDGYRNHPHVIIDDFDKNHQCLGHHLKRWGDRYPFPAEHKGHTYEIRPLKIIITSNYRPEEIFVDDPVLLQAILERFRLTHFTQSPFNPYCSTYGKVRLNPDNKQKRTVEDLVEEENLKKRAKRMVLDLVSSESSESSSDSEEESDSSQSSSSESVEESESSSDSIEIIEQCAQVIEPDSPTTTPRTSKAKVTFPSYADQLFDPK